MKEAIISKKDLLAGGEIYKQAARAETERLIIISKANGGNYAMTVDFGDWLIRELKEAGYSAELLEEGYHHILISWQ